MRNAIATPNDPVRGVGDFVGGGGNPGGSNLTDINIDLTGSLTIDPPSAEQPEPVYHTVTVAPSGADFTTIQAAIASITDATEANPYVIEVAPGIYTDTAVIDVSPGINIDGPQATVNALVGLRGGNHISLHKIETPGASSLSKVSGGSSYAKVNHIVGSSCIRVGDDNTLFCDVKQVETSATGVTVYGGGLLHCDIGQLIVGDVALPNIAMLLWGSVIGRVGVIKSTTPGVNNIGLQVGSTWSDPVQLILEVNHIETLVAYNVRYNRELHLKVGRVDGTRTIEAGSTVIENGVQTVTPVDPLEVWADNGTYKIGP